MSKTNLAKPFLFVVIVGVVVLFLVLRREPQPVAVGDAAPDFTLPTLAAGGIALRDFRRQVVVLNFWATWCPPCVTEAPSLEKFAEQMRGRGVTVVGVSVDEDSAALQKFVSQAHLSFPIARDADKAVAARYGTFKFPETYILDGNGKVAEKIVGAIDWQDPRIVSFVQELARGLGREGK